MVQQLPLAQDVIQLAGRVGAVEMAVTRPWPLRAAIHGGHAAIGGDAGWRAAAISAAAVEGLQR
jgi:hypothetical protein